MLGKVLLGGDGMIRPMASYAGKPIRDILVLEHGRNPTTDIYLRPRLKKLGNPPVRYADIRNAARSDEVHEGTFVIICRYMSSAWLRKLRNSRRQLAGVAYLADDDMPAALRDGTLPLRYRAKLFRYYGRHVAALSAIVSQLWLSTPDLAKKYKDCGPTVVSPVFVPAFDEAPMVRIAYHATAAHLAELRWLVGVVAAVQERCPNTLFEIFGDRAVRRLFLDVPRVVVLHPMSWPDYLAYASSCRCDIGLAPLLPSDTNAGRAPVKFFDMARIGAAGIFSDVPPYAGFVHDGVDGVLVRNESPAWSEEIARLVSSPTRRQQLAAAALERCMRALGNPSQLPGLLPVSGR